MKRRLSIISLTLAAVIWMGALPAAAESPTAFVQGIMNKTMTIQNDPALDTQARDAGPSIRSSNKISIFP